MAAKVPACVVARLGRATQHSEAVLIKRRSLGVLDHPLSRVMTLNVLKQNPHHCDDHLNTTHAGA